MVTFKSKFGNVEFTNERERHIFSFHPDVRIFKKYFAITVKNPGFIRKSKFDPKVFIFYYILPNKKYLSVVIKTNARNFVLTAYITKRIQHLPI